MPESEGNIEGNQQHQLGESSQVRRGRGRPDNEVQIEEGNGLPLGSVMRLLRNSEGIRLGELAKKIDYTRGTLSAIENNDRKPSIHLVELYEDNLGLDRGALTTWLKEDYGESTLTNYPSRKGGIPVPETENLSKLSLGSRMRFARVNKGITLGEFAKQIDYTRAHLSSVENNSRQTSKALIDKYEQILGLEPGELTSEDFEGQKANVPKDIRLG